MIDKETKISVIVPIYNVEKYLCECIESVINQTLSDKEYEIILVNDGSDDNSFEIAKRYYEKYNHINLIEQSNSGLSEARNTGMRAAKGKFIFFLDSDDLINDNNMLKECYEIACRDDLDMLMFDALTFLDNEYSKEENRNYDTYDRGDIIKEYEILKGTDFFADYYFSGGYVPSACMYIISHEYLLKHSFFFLKGLLHEDVEFTFKCLLSSGRVEYINKKFYKRRHRYNSITISEISLKHITSYGDIIIKNLELAESMSERVCNRKLTINLKQYYLDLFAHLIDNYSISNRINEEIIKKYIHDFFELYNGIFGKKLEINELKMVKHIKNNISNEELGVFFENTITDVYKLNAINGFNENMKLLRIDYIKEKLENVSLTDSKKIIGIYGLGEHTRQLIKFYENYIGEICAKLIFIDSYKKSLSEKFLNTDVINVNDVDNYKIDEIVISSASYEDEMLKTLKNTLYKNKIITLYSEFSENLFSEV